MRIILTFCFVAFSTIQTISCDDPLVEVEHGWLRGRVQVTDTGVQYNSFENIPYAQPPLGSLRFKAPQELGRWEGTRDATELGPMCAQYSSLSKLSAGVEDCLSLNVYSCDLTKASPVLVFISGFGYSFGPDYNDMYGADFLVENDVVVVTFNYRLDAFGFLKLGESVPGNAGLKDQVAVLKWVKNNIHRFGGDPNSVTLVGISAGSASIHHHIMSPLSSELFHRAVMMSGVPSCDAIYAHQVQEMSYYLGKHHGLETTDENELLLFLQSLPYQQLVNSSFALALEDHRNVLFKKMTTLVPDVEVDYGQERAITEPVTSLKNGILNKVPVMILYCNQEALIVVKQYVDYLIDRYNRYPELLIPNKILYKIDAQLIQNMTEMIKTHYFGDKDAEISLENIKEFIQCTSATNMVYDVVKYGMGISDLTDTYMLKFSSESSRNLYGLEGLQYGIHGAAHGDLITNLFKPKSLYMPIEANSKTSVIVKQITNSITNFVKFGKPEDNWPLFTRDDKKYVEFTDVKTLKQDLDENIEFWDRIYEMAGIHLYE